MINLETRPDRYESTIDLFSKIGVTNFELIRPLPAEEFSETKSALKPSMQSCKEAHLRIYRDAIAKGYQHIMIFEDDCVFNQDDVSIEQDIAYHIEKCLEFLRTTSWDMFYFDNIFIAKKKEMKMLEFVRLITQNDIQRFKGKRFSHSYAMNVGAAERLLEFSLSNDFNIDKDMDLWNSDKKFYYTRGVFDQKLNDITDNVWNTVKEESTK